MPKDQDKRYIAIAQACLKAINTSSENPEARESNIQRVYDAIDLAFREQLAGYETNEQNLLRVLQRIADDSTPADQARKLAKAALQTSSKHYKSTPLH